MLVNVALEKVIEAAIAGDLKFWAHSKSCALGFRFLDGAHDAIEIAFIVQDMLVEGASSDLRVISEVHVIHPVYLL